MFGNAAIQWCSRLSRIAQGEGKIDMRAAARAVAVAADLSAAERVGTEYAQTGPKAGNVLLLNKKFVSRSLVSGEE